MECDLHVCLSEAISLLSSVTVQLPLAARQEKICRFKREAWDLHENFYWRGSASFRGTYTSAGALYIRFKDLETVALFRRYVAL